MHLSEIQNRLRDRYLEIDRGSGVFFLLSVLVEEVGELAQSIRKKKGFGEELGDCIFVLLCMANLLDVNVEKHLVEKYLGKEDITTKWDDLP